MTTVKFVLDREENIKAFNVSGHAGFAPVGSDIVCAAVSSCVQMLEMCIAQVIGEEKASFSCDEKETVISYNLPENLKAEEAAECRKMLKGFYRYMQVLSAHYKQHLTFETEVKTC